ncbi:MAG: CpsD/CapB family tyrosine-protein kinase [Myxococcota bacterium]
MGKVYDALQRAEEQRAQRVGVGEGATALTPAADADLGVASSAPPRASRPAPWWRRVLARFGRRAAVEDAGAQNKRRITLLQPQSYVAEQFRTLRARIDSLAAQRPLHTVVVTSADEGDGKTMSAVNLALVMSMSVGRKIALVDCDMRSPRVHHSLGLRVDAGLAEVLLGEAELDRAIIPVEGTGLQVLPVRGMPANPSELLASAKMKELIEKLATDFDRVILDVPPTLGVPDARIVSELADGILFVVRAGSTPTPDVEAALDCLDRTRILGLVLNDAEVGGSDQYGAH